MRLTDIENLDWDFNISSSDPLSGIHPYPAKFIPEIPGLLLDTLDIPQGSVVLDPFCGSGVTLVESQKRGLESVGIDINPIACLLSEVKTKPLPLKTREVADSIINTCSSHIGPIYIPPIPNLDHWFKKDIQEALALLIFEINKLDDSVVKNALRLCFSSIVVKVSNQDSDTRYAAVDKKWVKEDVYAFFTQSVTRLVKIKRNMTISNTPVTVLKKSSLDLQGKDFDKKIGIVITSPPYPNAYEYWLYHKYRMWWLGFDPIDVKEHEIGARAQYFKKNQQTIDDFIQQMETLFESFKLLCIKNAYVCFVIGRSKIHGEIIENEKLIQSIGENKGFSHITTIKRTIRSSRKSFNLSHARIKEEYIVILQNK